MGVCENIIGGGGGGDILDGGGGGGRTQVADGYGGGGGGVVNDCGFKDNIQLWRGTTGDCNLGVTSDKGIVGVLYSDNRPEATLGAFGGVSSKTVNRSKGLGHRRRKGATPES